MLKPSEDLPPREGGRSFGELASQLVEDGKAYARAEIDLAKAIAADKGRSAGIAAVLFGIALLLAIGAVSALCVAIFVSLAYVMSPMLAGISTFVIVGVIAGAFGWFGYQKLRDAL